MTAPTLPPVSGEEDEGRVPRRRPSMSAVTTSPLVLGVAGAAAAAVVGLALAAAPMLVLWLASLEAGWVAPVRQTGLLWLVAQGAPIALAGITIDLLPWGLVLIPLVLLASAGAWATRRSGVAGGAALLWVVIPGAVAYAVIGAVVDLVVAEPAARVDLLHAVISCLVVAILGLSWGAVRASGLLDSDRIPAVARVPVRAGIVAAAVIIAAGAVAATVSLLVHIDDAITMTRALGVGLGGALGLLALGIAYLPVIVVWGSAYLLGAGVALGPQAAVSPFLPASAPASLPPFPLLAALPQQAPPLAWALPVVGVLAGIWAGVLIGRRLKDEQRLVRLACAAVSAAVAGVVLAVLAWVSSGSLGTQNLAQLGPDPSVVGMLAAVLVAVGALPTALAPSPPARPSLSLAAPAEEALGNDGLGGDDVVGRQGEDYEDDVDHGVNGDDMDDVLTGDDAGRDG